MTGPSRARRALAWALVALGGALLGVAYALPTVTYDRILSERETYSIYGGIEVLWRDGNWVLAAIVFFFSIVFPVAKLLGLAALLLERVPRGARGRVVEAIGVLGKWSMLDVFVIAAFVGAIRLGIATATSRPGIHVFSAAIVVSMAAAAVVARDERGGGGRATRSDDLPRDLPRRGLSVLAAAALAVGLAFPLFAVRKWLFANEVALPQTTRSLLASDEIGLGFALAFWVLGLTAARALVSLRLRFVGGAGARVRRAALLLDEWSMVDVFALALAIVWVKLEELATTTVGLGFWATLAAALVAEVDAWWLRRDLRPPRDGPPAS